MLSRIRHRSIHDDGDWLGENPSSLRAHPANRRRLVVFLATLVTGLVASLGYVWLRPPEYRAAARIEITPATMTAPAAAPAANVPAAGPEPETPRPFLTELQILTSRPVLQDVAARLARTGLDLSRFGSDPIAGMQAHLSAVPVPRTNVVEIVAAGPDADLLAPLVNTTIDAYRERLARAFEASTSEALAQADDQVKRLQESVEAKRRDLEAFRLKNNIVSLERDENAVLAQVKSLGVNLSNANERMVAAEGKLRALNESAAAGNPVTRQRDDPTLTNLEQRRSQAQEELRDMERTYTQDYLAREPKAVAVRARIAELERQIAVQRDASRKAALSEAQEEYSSTAGAVARIQSQITAGRSEVGQFTTRYNEFKAKQDDLTELEKTFRDASQKRARLEASERSRMPSAKLIEAASAPGEAWRPLYWRDTGIAAAGSLLLALLTMWLVELFNRTEPQPAVVLVRPTPAGMSYEGKVGSISIQGASLGAVERAEPVLLSSQPKLPRELSRDEVTALVQASDAGSRLAVLLLLGGLTVGEAIALRVGDVDFARGVIRVGGEAGREIALGEALRAELGSRAEAASSELLLGQRGGAATREGIDAQILCAAHDAGLDQPAGIDSDCLRHTYVAFLVRQGIRFADLASLVGELPADVLGAYTTFAPPGPRVARERIETSYPSARANVAG
ncbi:MAG TPA: tyrosine-type recombinase/integrase [Casimicrobiaceae bacterium]|nr:tyrosine-type recombinase/integrase [Casimicrobiaceae bacterium]